MIRAYIGRDATKIETAALAAQTAVDASVMLWPELSAGPNWRPVHADEIAARMDKILAVHGPACTRVYIIATMAEMAVLRLRRRVAEGTLTPGSLVIVDVDSGREIHVDGSGVIDWWPDGLFSEDFAEVKAIRRAQRAGEMSTEHIALRWNEERVPDDDSRICPPKVR